MLAVGDWALYENRGQIDMRETHCKKMVAIAPCVPHEQTSKDLGLLASGCYGYGLFVALNDWLWEGWN